MTNFLSKAKHNNRSIIGFLFLCTLLLGLGYGAANAQEHPAWLNAWGIPEKPLSCEENLIHIEIVGKLASEEDQRTGMMIVIARLGDGERLQELNRRRLHNVRVSLTENLGVDPRRIVVASGEKVNGLGRVEFYLGGKLVGGLPVKRGKDLCADCCDIDERYYPYRRDGKRRR